MPTVPAGPLSETGCGLSQPEASQVWSTHLDLSHSDGVVGSTLDSRSGELIRTKPVRRHWCTVEVTRFLRRPHTEA